MLNLTIFLDINYFRLDYLFGLYYLNERQVTTACSHPISPFSTERPEDLIKLPYKPNPYPNHQTQTVPKDNLRNWRDSNWNDFRQQRLKRNIYPTTIIRNKVQCLDETPYSQNLLVPKYCPTDNNCNGILHHCKVVPSASFCEAVSLLN